MIQTFQSTNLLFCCKQKQQEYNHLYDKICTYSVIMEGYGLCFARELQFSIGYPGLGVPVPLIIVFLI